MHWCHPAVVRLDSWEVCSWPNLGSGCSLQVQQGPHAVLLSSSPGSFSAVAGDHGFPSQLHVHSWQLYRDVPRNMYRGADMCCGSASKPCKRPALFWTFSFLYIVVFWNMFVELSSLYEQSNKGKGTVNGTGTSMSGMLTRTSEAENCAGWVALACIQNAWL